MQRINRGCGYRVGAPPEGLFLQTESREPFLRRMNLTDTAPFAFPPLRKGVRGVSWVFPAVQWPHWLHTVRPESRDTRPVKNYEDRRRQSVTTSSGISLEVALPATRSVCSNLKRYEPGWRAFGRSTK
jgi:hypothetical protein